MDEARQLKEGKATDADAAEDGTGPDNDRQVCADAAIRPGSTYALGRMFLPGLREDSFLAWRALAESLLSVADSVTDPGVGAAKLAWWHQELQPGTREASQHPVVRTLERAECWERLDERQLALFLTAVARHLDPEPEPDEEGMRAMFLDMGDPFARLDVAMLDSPSVPQGVGLLIAAGWLYRRSGRLVEDAREGRWWVPMSAQAEFGLDRQSVAGERGEQLARPLVEWLYEHALEWLQEAQEMMAESIRRRSDTVGRWYRVQSQLLERRIVRGVKNPRAHVQREGLVTRTGDVVAAWRGARG